LARIRWQFCANFLRLLFVYETSHVSDETRSLPCPFWGALNHHQLAKWACHHLVFPSITLLGSVVVFVLGRLSLESKIQQLANVTKAAKTFHDLSRPFRLIVDLVIFCFSPFRLQLLPSFSVIFGCFLWLAVYCIKFMPVYCAIEKVCHISVIFRPHRQQDSAWRKYKLANIENH